MHTGHTAAGCTGIELLSSSNDVGQILTKETKSDLEKSALLLLFLHGIAAQYIVKGCARLLGRR